ncbi:NADH-quinone oxidoreductase subunit N [Bacteriovoracaceae bacterium]|nr:NADH-quinone oxidoreductase subunit N [Bacteriovoracaceae bacterium]
MLEQLLSHLGFYIPEVLLIILMCSLLFIEAGYGSREKGRVMVYYAAFAGLFLTAIMLCLNFGHDSMYLFSNAIVIDKFGTLAKLIMVVGTAATFIISLMVTDFERELKPEFLIMGVGVLIGGMLLVSANNFLTLYLGIETLSILSYVMASFKRSDSRSSEAGIKYLLYGGVTAGIMLFGLSHLYGVIGSIQFTEVFTVLKTVEGTKLASVLAGFLLFFVGIGYKISCFPFHMWTPDVYEGSPISVTTFFSIVPKIAGLSALIRITSIFFASNNELSEFWVLFIHLIAVATMTVGNVSAIKQVSMKRMLAFSSIGHVGFMLLGIVVIDTVGYGAILFYLLTYVFMTLVAFYITAILEDYYGTDTMASFKGLVKKHPWLAIIMSCTLFSLAGMPPFSGFVAKFNLLSAIIDKGYFSLAFIAAINSVIALYYYVMVTKYMILGDVEFSEKAKTVNFNNQLIISFLFFPIVFLGIFWEKVYTLAQNATIFLP